MFRDRDTVTEVIRNGAMGFIPKSSGRETIVNALQLVLAGSVYVPRGGHVRGRHGGGPAASRWSCARGRSRHAGTDGASGTGAGAGNEGTGQQGNLPRTRARGANREGASHCCAECAESDQSYAGCHRGSAARDWMPRVCSLQRPWRIDGWRCNCTPPGSAFVDRNCGALQGYFDDPVCSQQQGLRHRQAQRLRGFQVDRPVRPVWAVRSGDSAGFAPLRILVNVCWRAGGRSGPCWHRKTAGCLHRQTAPSRRLPAMRFLKRPRRDTRTVADDALDGEHDSGFVA